MRRFQYIAALAFIWAGVMSAAQVPCPVNTAAYYEATFTSLANGCTIGPLVFWGFNAMPHGAVPKGPGIGLSTDADVLITPVSDANGIGFDFTSSTGWTALSGGTRTYKLPFVAGCGGVALPGFGLACLSKIFVSISGSGAIPGYAKVIETYCPGSFTLPPTAPCPLLGIPVSQGALFVGPGTTSTSTRTDTFPAVSEISVNQDMEANAAATAEYDFFFPGGTGVAAKFLSSGLVRDVSPVSTPIPGFTGFTMPSFASLSPCDLTSSSSAELDCRTPTVHGGIFSSIFDYGAFPSKFGPFTGSGFTAPDGATPGLGSVRLQNGQVASLSGFEQISVYPVWCDAIARFSSVFPV